MIAAKKDLIVQQLEEGTGASIAATVNQGGLRSGMQIRFADLDERHGPVTEIRPHGLKGHRVKLTFGDFSGAVIRQILNSSDEDVQLARALIASIDPSVSITIGDQSLEGWTVSNGAFQLEAKIRHATSPDADEAISWTCREVIIPIMAAMAELIGYDLIDEETHAEEPAFEGAIKPSIVNRRERNPRNRLLCIRLHGESCIVCGMEPHKIYSAAGGIIEVHHLEPLAMLASPRPYDPGKDLVPLCPSCHRAVHTRRPSPWTIDELKALMEIGNG